MDARVHHNYEVIQAVIVCLLMIIEKMNLSAETVNYL